jgi:hypothetical protein
MKRQFGTNTQIGAKFHVEDDYYCEVSSQKLNSHTTVSEEVTDGKKHVYVMHKTNEKGWGDVGNSLMCHRDPYKHLTNFLNEQNKKDQNQNYSMTFSVGPCTKSTINSEYYCNKVGTKKVGIVKVPKGFECTIQNNNFALTTLYENETEKHYKYGLEQGTWQDPLYVTCKPQNNI